MQQCSYKTKKGEPCKKKQNSPLCHYHRQYGSNSDAIVSPTISEESREVPQESPQDFQQELQESPIELQESPQDTVLSQESPQDTVLSQESPQDTLLSQESPQETDVEPETRPAPTIIGTYTETEEVFLYVEEEQKEEELPSLQEVTSTISTLLAPSPPLAPSLAPFLAPSLAPPLPSAPSLLRWLPGLAFAGIFIAVGIHLLQKRS